MREKKIHRNQSLKINTSTLVRLFFIIGCVGIVIDTVVLFYVSYIRMSKMFLIGAIGVSFVSPLFITSIYDIYKSIEEDKNSFDKFDYTMMFIGECGLIYAAIIIFVEYT